MIRAPIRLACVLSLAALCGLRANPSTFTWTGTLNSDVSTVGNWTVDGLPAATAPAAEDTLFFGPATRTNLVFTAGSAVAKVVIASSAEPLAYTFGGSSASLSLAGASGEGLRVEGNSKVSFANTLTFNVGGSQTWFMDNGTSAYIDGPISSASALTLTKAGGGDLHVRGLTSGLSGNVSVNAGTLHLWTATAFGNATVSVSSEAALASAAADGTAIASTVSLASGAQLGSSEGFAGRNQLVFTGTVTAGSSVILAEGSQSYFEGAFNGTVADSSITFSGGGFAVLLGTTDTANLTADGAGLVINTSGSLPSGALLATGGGYLGMGAGFTGSVSPNTPADFITKIATPASFAGTLGFDTDPRAGGGPNDFTGEIDLSGFTHPDFLGLGSATHANITGAITAPNGATAYKFGGGGGRLTVGSALSGSLGLSVASPATAPLTLVLTGDNRPLTEAVTVENSFLIFDDDDSLDIPADLGNDANALPAGSIQLNASGYVSATEKAAISASTLLGKISSASPTAVLGFDSSAPASTARTVTDAISLGSFSGYLGTTTFAGDGLKLTGTISRTSPGSLKLAGLNSGKLTVDSDLLDSGKITSVVVGHPDPKLGRNGTVVLSGASDYIGGTTLQRGTLLLGSSSSGDGSTGPLGKSTGALTVKQNADGEAAILAPAGNSATLLNDIILEADAYLRVGRDTGNLTLGGNLSGSGQLWFVGPTVTTLAGASTRDGETYVQDAAVHVAANTGLASAHLFVINGTVAFGSAATSPTIGSLSGTPGSVLSFGAAATTLTINQTLEYNPVIENKYAGTFSPSGTLSLVKTGGAALWLSAANTISGNVTVNQGTLGFSGNGTISGEVNVSSGSVNFANPNTFTTGNAYIGTEAGQTGSVEIFTGSRWSSTGYVKVGAGQQATGTLFIEEGAHLSAAGTLYIAHAPASSGTVQVIGPGATLSASSLVIADGGQIGGTGPYATGTLAILNGGTVTLSGGAEIRPTGTIDIGDGSSAGSFSANDGLTNNGTLNFNLGAALSFATTIEGSGVINKQGTGTLTLSGNNADFTGDLHVLGGAVDLAHDHAIGTAALQIDSTGAANFSSSNPSIGSLSGGAGAAISMVSSSTLTVSVIDDSTYAGSIAGDGALTLKGTGSGATLTLSGTNTYTGGTTITNGSVVVAQSGQALGTAGTVNVNGGTLAVAAGQTLAFASGSHPLVLTSGTLAGLGTYSLDTSLSIGSNQSLAPGVGTLAFNLNNGSGTLTFASDGAYVWQVQDQVESPDTEASLISVTGALAVSASTPFHLKLATVCSGGQPGTLANFSATTPTSWTILTATSITGFDPDKFTIDTTGFLNPTDSGLFSLAQDGNALTLNFTPVPEPSTWVLLITGLATLTASALRRGKRS